MPGEEEEEERKSAPGVAPAQAPKETPERKRRRRRRNGGGRGPGEAMPSARCHPLGGGHGPGGLPPPPPPPPGLPLPPPPSSSSSSSSGRACPPGRLGSGEDAHLPRRRRRRCRRRLPCSPADSSSSSSSSSPSSSSPPPPPFLPEMPPEEPPPPPAALRLALDQLARLGFPEEEEEEEEEEEGRGRRRAGEAAVRRGGRGGGAAAEEEEAARARAALGAEDAADAARDAGALDHCASSSGGGGMLLLLLREGGDGRRRASPGPFFLGGFPRGLPPGGLPPSAAAAPHKRSVNMTECVAVPSSEHVAEIVGRQGCKIKALRAKTNTYIKTPVRGEEPVFIVTGRKEDVEMAKQEILLAAEHFSMIRATRNRASGVTGSVVGPPNLPGQTSIQVRVPYRVVGLVVGPKGATIKRIQQQTDTYIVTPSRDKEPVFEVTGMPENVDRAREEIEAHITLRTGDFRSNGTDACLDFLGGSSSALWSKAPNPTRRTLPGLHNRSLGSLGSAPSAAELYFEASPHSPFGSNSSFPCSEAPASLLGSDDGDFGFDGLAFDLARPAAIWSPFEPSANPLQALGSGSGSSQRRHSSFSGTASPRHSPTLPESGVASEHPLAGRIQSDPVSALPWVPSQGSLSSFSNSTGYSSFSSLPNSLSGTSGSPTESSSSDGACRSSHECMVCFDREVIAALVPCGHNLFCMECAVRICRLPHPECPACHTPATQAIHIFS